MINFSQPVYTVGESSEALVIQLILSNPSSIDITVVVISEEINATGESIILTYVDPVHTGVLCKCILLILQYST